ncbi:MAG: CPBP family intramembrane metalloprotease [Flavobacteriaceae bacterium]|nr:CPBP family intramembrane metalloprotease [Flavobacteriaceae bacterium]
MYQPKQYTESFRKYLIGSAIIVLLSVLGGLGSVFYVQIQGYDLISWHPILGHNVFLVTSLMTFVFGFVGLVIVIKFIHKRSLLTIISIRHEPFIDSKHSISLNVAKTFITDDATLNKSKKTKLKIDCSKIWYSFGLTASLIILFFLIELLIRPEIFTWNFQAIPFLILICVALFLIPIQAGLEELIFRGYLVQGFERLYHKRWFPLVMTSLLFAGLHLTNPEFQTFGYGLIGTYFLFGLIAGIISYLDDGIELAIGLHIANNMISILFISPDWAVFPTDALYTTGYQPKLMEFYLNIVLIYGICFLLFARKYKWKNWKVRLLGTAKDVFSK